MKGYYDLDIGLELRHHGFVTLFSFLTALIYVEERIKDHHDWMNNGR
jgi:hypothetical protein